MGRKRLFRKTEFGVANKVSNALTRQPSRFDVKSDQ